MQAQTPKFSLRISRFQLFNELLVILLYILALTILTYPLVFRISTIIPFHSPDTYTAIWQNWWLKASLMQGLDAHYTNYLFYPSGLDTTLIPQRWTVLLLWMIYEMGFGEPSAYNLTVLTETVIRAYAMFRFILLFVPHRPSAWVGGAFFAFVPRILVAGIQQPNTGALEFIPVFMIFFVLAIRDIRQYPSRIRPSVLLMVMASFAFSANVYMNIKIGIFAVLIGGFYITWQFVTARLWRYRSFWVASTAFIGVSSVICAPILVPTLAFGGLNDAIAQFVPGAGIDLIAYVKADLDYPFFYNYVFAARDGVQLTQRMPTAFSQIGFVSILVGLLGIVYVLRRRPRQRFWFVLLLLSFWLSLGTVLRINGESYDDLPMLMSLLQYNPLFQTLRDPFRFQILVIFTLSIFVAHGSYVIFKWLPHRISTMGLLLMVGLMFFEISVFPIPYRSASIPEVYDFVMERHNGPLIIMPMGRQPSKYKMYNQTYHGLPIAEGMIARMPDNAYSTFDSYLLLRDMGDMDELARVRDDLLENWDTEIQRLLDVCFRYVIVHRLEDTGRWPIVTHAYQEFMFFMEIEPDYVTDTAVVYDLEKLIGNPPMGDPLTMERDISN